MLQEITGDSVREQAVLGKQILCSLAAVPFPLWWMLWRPSLRLGWKPSMKQVTAEECQQRSLLSSEVTAHPQNHTKEFDTATLTFHSFQDTKFPTPWNLPKTAHEKYIPIIKNYLNCHHTITRNTGDHKWNRKEETTAFLKSCIVLYVLFLIFFFNKHTKECSF